MGYGRLGDVVQLIVALPPRLTRRFLCGRDECRRRVDLLDVVWRGDGDASTDAFPARRGTDSRRLTRLYGFGFDEVAKLAGNAATPGRDCAAASCRCARRKRNFGAVTGTRYCNNGPPISDSIRIIHLTHRRRSPARSHRRCYLSATSSIPPLAARSSTLCDAPHAKDEGAFAAISLLGSI